ncbi:hypothetical protein EJ04DRAFT_504115 [Polyplosphaeria fusca]|uniref:Uncharacterized protein n=1 Tax=Polyplosphaeria fusca TaxID=682080 RepID=A0A9P4QNZ1_9PLEO|nr:hypothetical protein EJ04DRAFT_504115 [Polyplosphaeria fusca]
MSSEDEKHSRSHTGSELDRIMEFLDTGARDGDCQTAEGKNLKRYCRRATDLLGDQDVAPEHVLRALDKIRKKSREISAIDDEQLRKDLKADLYGYGFHTFGLLTVSLFDWTAQTYSKPEESIPALQMICGVIDGVVTLKNTVASWKMKLPQRFKGDRLIKDVDETLVVPLRKLSTSLRGKLRYLEELEQQKRSREQRLAEHQRLEAEKETRENFRALEALRKKRWINLHVARKAVEPDIRRAWKLNAPSLPPLDLEERDANGEPFQRLEVFSKRSTPPVPPCSPLKGPEWPEEAMVALISGLEAYAGPFVFERIFKKYCKPGGSLRNYSVLDLASKAADFKARMIRDFGKHNAIWVKRVPSSWEEVPE